MSLFSPERDVFVTKATRMQRYAFFLSVYDYEISYKCTKTRIVYRDYLYQTVNRTMRLIGHILNELHVGHIGVAKMKALTSEERGMVWWPGIDTKIKEITKSFLDVSSSNGRQLKRQFTLGSGQADHGSVSMWISRVPS